MTNQTSLEQLYIEEFIPIAKSIDGVLLSVEQIPDWLQEMYLYAVEDGRRVRPMLTYIAYKICGGLDNELVYPVAAGLELLHKASLLHDDIIDEDTLRRTRPTFHTVYGWKKAIILGDYLVARSFDYLNSISDRVSAEIQLSLTRELSQVYHTLTCGELHELVLEGKILNFDDAWNITYGKTGSLIESSLRMGAKLADASEEQIMKLAEFGKLIGCVFQVINDFNNFTELETKIKGRKFGDLESGRFNIPLFELSKFVGEEQFNALWEKVITSEDNNSRVAAFDQIQSQIVSAPVSERIKGHLTMYTSEAVKVLSYFPTSKFRTMLEVICNDVFNKWFWAAKIS